MTEIRRISHCSHWGAYTILVADNEIIGIEPSPHDPTPSPIIHSVKEWAKPERRLLQPMVREGWLAKREKSDRSARGSERFIRIGWDQASKLIADEINRVRTTFGNASIFAGSYGWTSCGRFHHAPTLLKRVLNLVGGFTGHVDTYSYGAGPVILRHVLGSEDALNGHATTLDLVAEHTETLLVFGALSPRTAQNEAGGITRRTFEQNLRELSKRKAQIVLVSPLRDDIPAWADADWWPVIPGTDTALMIGLACEIVKAGHHNQEFIDRYCSGAEKYIDYVMGRSDGVLKDADWAAAITGIDKQLIRDLARKIATTRTMISVSWSLQRAQYGEQPYWAALALAAIAGQIGLPGGGVGYGYGSLGGIGASFGVGKNPAMNAGKKVLDSFIPVARIADLLLNPGKSFTYAGEERTYPDTRLVYWAGGNPYHHHQDLNRLQQAWAKPETIIVQDPMFTATVKRADIILPASTSIERNDIAANGRSDLIIAMQQAIEPLGSSRSDYEIFRSIADRLGVEEAFSKNRNEMEWLQHLYETARAHNTEKFGIEVPDFDTFWDVGYAPSPMKSNYNYLGEFREDPERNPLDTESGRIVIGSKMLEKLNYPDCKSHPAWFEPVEWLGARDEPGQLHLISNQPKGRLHSQLETGPSSLMQKRKGRERATLNPADAEALSINEGQTIRLSNRRGSCLAVAMISDTVRQGVIMLPTGAWFTPTGNSGLEISGNPNVLTFDIPSSSFGQGCAAYTCVVRVEPYEGDTADAMEQYRDDLARLLPQGS